ncbi:MAG: hypothetical protein RIC16_17155 [Rhodospirillales bacterium]
MAANALDADGFGANYAPPSQQHLVVESRTDDRWRVELCTTLDDLDTALDTAKALRGDGNIDEVCLTLETTGTNGREVRREILRLGAAETAVPAQRTAAEATEDFEADDEAEDDEILDAILPCIKIPDYEIDEEILDSLTPRPALSTMERFEETVPEAPEPRISANPVYGIDNGPSEDEARAAARALVNSLYGLHSEIGAEHADRPAPRSAEETIDLSDVLPMSEEERRRNQDDAEHAAAEAEAIADLENGNWVTGVETASHSRFAASGRLEAGEERVDAAERLERPLIGDPSGAASKAFIVAGTLAMMVLGGAIAELLTINLTSPAMADQMSVSLQIEER